MTLRNIWKKNQIKKTYKMGKREKEHRKRVQKRNNRIKMEQKHHEKKMNDLFMKQMEMMKDAMEKSKTEETDVESTVTEKSE